MRYYTGLLVLLMVLFSTTSKSQSGNWFSSVTSGNIRYTVNDADAPLKDNTGKYITIVYLENLGFEKIGQNSNQEDVDWLLSQGYRVIELNYADHANAISPNINQDIIKINDAIASGSFCGKNNGSQYQSYILFEGYRIKRNVPYFVDDPSVYNYPSSYTVGDSLRMDFVYPANTKEDVPVVLSFSYSNSYAGAGNQNLRLLLGYTLAGFDDSFLEGAPAMGTAWAIADHPKYCPWGNGKPANGANDTYKSYMVNPDAAQKVKSAVRTLRALGDGLGLSGKVGIYGFSRGSSAGAMAVGDKYDEDLENVGFHIGVSDDVQAAALGPGVFDFTQIYNQRDDGDKNLEGRCPWAWGPLEENYDLWYSMGASSLVETSASAPVFFFYNTDDSHHYQDQITHFKKKLESLKIPVSTLVNYGSGHAVPQTHDALQKLYDFFTEYLSPPSLKIKNDTTSTKVTPPFENKSEASSGMKLSVFPNPVHNVLQVQFTTTAPGLVQISILNMNGTLLSSTSTYLSTVGVNRESIQMTGLNLNQGPFLVTVILNGEQRTRKFIKILS